MTTAGILLAAGGGSRFGGPTHKLLSPFRGQPLVVSALDAAIASGLDEIAVVSGVVDLAPLCPDNVVLLHNPDWQSELASSLQVGLRWARRAHHDAVVIGLGDSPGVPASAWAEVAASAADVAVASFNGELRPPVRLGKAVWNDVPTVGDIGARRLWDRPGAVSVPCIGDPRDIDTEIDLVELEGHLGRGTHES